MQNQELSSDYQTGFNGHNSFGDDTASFGGDGDAAENISVSTEGTQLADAETRAVSWLRATVLTILTVATVCVSGTVYSHTSKAQNHAFHAAYTDAASQVTDEFRIGWEPLEALGVDFLSYAKYSGSAWPKVALPDFVDRAMATKKLAHASSVWLAPVITSETLSDWESFSVENCDWLYDKDNVDTGSRTNEVTAQARRVLSDTGISDHVFDFDGPVSGDGPFMPLWQFAPSTTENLTQWVNIDLASVPRGLGSVLYHAVANAQPLVGAAVNIKSAASASVPEPITLDLLLRTLLGPRTNYSAEPVSPLVYPLVDEADSAVGLLVAMHYWRHTLEHVLQPSARGIVAVIHNTCGQDQELQAFTYRLDGANVTYLGDGDLHDKQFNHMVKTSSLETSTADAKLSVKADFCGYSLSVYPSKEMEKMYVTSAPLMHCAVVFFVFLSAAVIFLAYDLLVEYRQKVVMDHALQSTAIVSSLFPEAVRDRLFNEDDGAGSGPRRMQRRRSSDGGGSFLFESPKNAIKTFIGGGGGDDASTDGVPASSGPNKPIADLFPHCTVLFADIAGFTAWSSLRDPAQVFTLLEAIYHSFDQ